MVDHSVYYHNNSEKLANGINIIISYIIKVPNLMSETAGGVCTQAFGYTGNVHIYLFPEVMLMSSHGAVMMVRWGFTFCKQQFFYFSIITNRVWCTSIVRIAHFTIFSNRSYMNTCGRRYVYLYSYLRKT